MSTPAPAVPFFTVITEPIQYELPSFMTAISSGGIDGSLDLTDRFPDAITLNPSSSTLTQLFALRRLLESEQVSGLVGLGHDRTFAISQVGDCMVGGALTRFVTPASFAALAHELFLGDGTSLIVPPTLDVAPNVLSHYQAHHYSRDLLYFFGLSVDLGVITGRQAAEFLAQATFIAGPTVGVFPAPWLVVALSALEAVVREYETHFLIERLGYQGASVSFCGERLMGLFVQCLANQWPPSDRRLNQTLVVQDCSDVIPAGAL